MTVKDGKCDKFKVRIVSKRPDRSIIMRVVCNNCGSKLEYVPQNVKRYSGTDIGGGPDGCEWIVCPNCRENVILKSW